MQKVLRRTALAKSQAARKARIQAEKELTRDTWAYRNQASVLRSERTAAARQAREQRRETYELGPLAPWRTHSQAIESHGTFHARQMNPPRVPAALRVKDWFIREGDRVCVVKGREGLKGKIGKVVSVDKESETVKIEGVNMVDIRLPAALQSPNQPTFNTTEAPVALADIQLVYPLPDPTTGIPRDALLTNLVKRDAYHDIYRGEEVWHRYLEPQHVRIPWPAASEPEPADTPADTLRVAVDDATWLPTLLRPPMPAGVIDELRGRYSLFRERHDEDWVRMKEREDERAEMTRARASALVPRPARNIARRGRAADGEVLPRPAPKLAESVLERIGRHMAEKKAAGARVGAGWVGAA